MQGVTQGGPSRRRHARGAQLAAVPAGQPTSCLVAAKAQWKDSRNQVPGLPNVVVPVTRSPPGTPMAPKQSEGAVRSAWGLGRGAGEDDTRRGLAHSPADSLLLLPALSIADRRTLPGCEASPKLGWPNTCKSGTRGLALYYQIRMTGRANWCTVEGSRGRGATTCIWGACFQPGRATPGPAGHTSARAFPLQESWGHGLADTVT